MHAETKLQGSQLDSVDVTEVYSEPRMALDAKKFGLKPGSSPGVTGTDEEGCSWDFPNAAMRRNARKRIDDEDPHIVIGSHMCRDLCQMMTANLPKMSPLEKGKRLEEARQHIKFVCSLHRDHRKRGKYYMREHPAQATSWQEADTTNLGKGTRAKKVTFDVSVWIGHIQRQRRASTSQEGNHSADEHAVSHP